MHHQVLVRGINTTDDDHGRGAVQMLTGRKPDPAFQYPEIGAVAAKLLTSGSEELPRKFGYDLEMYSEDLKKFTIAVSV